MKEDKYMGVNYGMSVLAGIGILVASTSCWNAGTSKNSGIPQNSSTSKTERIEGTEWEVTVHKVVEFNDSLTGVGTEYKYTAADTSRVNEVLSCVKPETGRINFSWTLPSADGTIWLVAYDNTPLLSETVSVTEANSIPAYGGNIQVGFKFPDAQKWAAITGENIGNRLAIFVNGRLMNAPQMNTEITSGNCSVAIPAEMIHYFLPDLRQDFFE